MHAVSAAELMDVWEWGVSRNPVERALALLSAAWPQRSLDELARLPIGRRDALLLRMRSALFGADLDVRGACPGCREALELILHADELIAAAGRDDADSPVGPQTLEVDGRLIRFRLPDSLDLLDALGSAEPRRTLLGRCIVSDAPDHLSADDGPSDVSAAIEASLVTRMESLDPLASASFTLTCPACAHVWDAPLDVPSFLWNEIDAWAYRTIREVHWLAISYGWRETDVLALGAWRRQAYLQVSGYA